MNRTIVTNFFLLMCFLSIPALQCHAFDYVMGVERVRTLGAPGPKPERGVPFVDPAFGTSMVRLSDALTEGKSDTTSFAIPRYAKFSPECYSFIRYINMPFGNGEPRWHGTDPDIIYFTDGMILYQYACESDSYIPIRDFSKDFPGNSRIYMDDEGDASADSRYWAWFVTRWIGSELHKIQAFCYDRDAETNGIADTDGRTGEILGLLSESDFATRHTRGANWISMTDSGATKRKGGTGT